MIQVGDRGIFNVAGQGIYGRVVKLEDGNVLIESFDGNLQKRNFVIKDNGYSNEIKKQETTNAQAPKIRLQTWKAR